MTTSGEILGWRAGLDALHARIAGRFRRSEARDRAKRYLAGLLDWAERLQQMFPPPGLRVTRSTGMPPGYEDGSKERTDPMASPPRRITRSGRMGKSVRADALVITLPVEALASHSAGAGSQGERLYDWAIIGLPGDGVPDTEHWLLARRSRHDPTELAYCCAFVPEGRGIEELARVASMR